MSIAQNLAYLASLSGVMAAGCREASKKQSRMDYVGPPDHRKDIREFISLMVVTGSADLDARFKNVRVLGMHIGPEVFVVMLEIGHPVNKSIRRTILRSAKPSLPKQVRYEAFKILFPSTIEGEQ